MKFAIKESSIKDEVNKRYFDMVKNELLKHVPTITFGEPSRFGNYAICESTDFSDTDIHYSSDVKKLEVFVDNILNFRYENFYTHYAK